MPTEMLGAAQLHLALNHLPVIGVLIATIVLIVGAGARSTQLKSFGLALLVCAAVTAVPAYLTGEPAEEAIEDRPGISKSLIERHEEAAETALAATLVAGAIAAAAWLSLRSGRLRIAHGAFALALVASLGATGLLAWTAHLGGQIRHDEIRPGSIQGAYESGAGSRGGERSGGGPLGP